MSVIIFFLKMSTLLFIVLTLILAIMVFMTRNTTFKNKVCAFLKVENRCIGVFASFVFGGVFLKILGEFAAGSLNALFELDFLAFIMAIGWFLLNNLLLWPCVFWLKRMLPFFREIIEDHSELFCEILEETFPFLEGKLKEIFKC